jgi:DnaJ-class molecular chaperone
MPTVTFKDYYKTLGVERGADDKTLRTAYRKLARQHHPDLNPGEKAAEERFKEVNEAYEVLSDAEKRKLYDRFGEDWQRYRDAGFTGDEPVGQAMGGRPGGGARPGAYFDPNDFGAWFSGQTGSGGQSGEWVYTTGGDADDGEGFSEFFQTLFGSRGRARAGSGATTATRAARPRRGQDLETPVEISFDEAFKGATRQLSLQAPETCPTCGGVGFVRGAPCPTCDGTGVTSRSRTLEVTIPPGVATGSRVRIGGQGGPGEAGGPSGDVYLVVTVRPDARFEREGDDLRTEIDVPVTTAVLGGEAVVPTPTGKVALTIPAGSQAGRSFRLRGQGMPKLKGAKGQRGDLLARIRVLVPTEITPRERELYEELQQLRPEGARS